MTESKTLREKIAEAIMSGNTPYTTADDILNLFRQSLPEKNEIVELPGDKNNVMQQLINAHAKGWNDYYDELNRILDGGMK